MFLKLTAADALQFEDRQNFRAFKLVVEGAVVLDAYRVGGWLTRPKVDAPEPGVLPAVIFA